MRYLDARAVAPTARSRGFGLVEIMVGLVVGLISMVVVMQVYSVFEQQKRATTTGSDAQSNGALALFWIERDLRSAGTGITEGEPQKYPPLAGCPTHVFDANAQYLVPNATAPFVSTVAGSGVVSTVRFAPAMVSDGGGGASDALTLVYGTTAMNAPYTLNAPYAPGGPTIGLVSAAGIGINGQQDMIALIEEDSNPALKANGKNYKTPKTCSLLQVTCPASGCPSALPVPAGRFNRGGGTGLTPFTDEARLYNLGLVNLVTYRISGNNLVADVTRFGVIPDGSTGGAVANRTDFSPLASNIVNMQVQYGVDTGNSGTANCKTAAAGSVTLTAVDADAVVDSWVDATGRWANDGATTPTLFDQRRVRAVRIGLVARNAAKARGTADDPCNATPITIRWPSGPDMTPDLTGDPDWQCYRYKVFQTTVPIRNTLWSSTMNPASTASCGLRDPS